MGNDRVLKFDYRGAPQTISVMRHAALSSEQYPVVRSLAEEICQGIDSKDYVSEYLAIYQFVLKTCRYMRDPRNVELVRAPHVIAEQILAGKRPNIDCDDMATFIAGLILSIGGVVQFVTVAFRKMYFQGEQQYSHVLDRAQDPRTGQQIILDPVAAEKTGQMLSRVRAARVWTV